MMVIITGAAMYDIPDATVPMTDMYGEFSNSGSLE